MNEETKEYEIHEFEDEQEILKKISDEYTRGFEHVEKKRKIKSEEIRLYVEDVEDKIKIHTIYTLMQTYMSVFFTGERSVRWTGIGVMKEKAENLNEVAEMDYKEERLGQKDYQWIWNSGFFGVGVQLYVFLTIYLYLTLGFRGAKLFYVLSEYCLVTPIIFLN